MPDLLLLAMKSRFSLFGMLFFALSLAAQTHIQVSDPSTWSAQELAPYVGQTVIFDVPMVVNSTTNNPFISTRRLYSATNQTFPGSTAYDALVALNNSGGITLNNAPIPSGEPWYRCGARIYNLKVKVNSTHELTWISGEWRGNTRAELSKGIPDLGDYRLLICTANLEYYLAANTGSGSMGPSSYSEHQIQRTKVNKALSLINADAYGLVEIEQGQEALQEIAEDLNKKHTDRHYTYIDDGSKPNGTYTKAGYIYDANKLRPIGALQEFKGGGSSTIRAERHKMQCFEEIATGERFVFSVNHFKAKSGSGSGRDADQGDGQGAYNGGRTDEAESVVSYFSTRYGPAIKEKDILIMGDLNAYAKEDPITLFLEHGMLDLHRAFHADTSYSYQYGTRAGYLDHAICNGSLFKQVTGMCGFHINSDENDNFTYGGKWSDNTMFRCSDHDPVLVGLKLDSTLTYDPTPTLNNAEVLSGETNQLIISNAFKADQRSFYTIHSISGLLIDNKEIKSEYQRIELPATPGIYIVNIFADGKVFQRKMIVR